MNEATKTTGGTDAARRVEVPVGQPVHKHDCERCVFLGNYLAYDLYFCNQGGNWPTVIARFGSEGSEYTSGLGFKHIGIVEAQRRATERGLLPSND